MTDSDKMSLILFLAIIGIAVFTVLNTAKLGDLRHDVNKIMEVK